MTLDEYIGELIVEAGIFRDWWVKQQAGENGEFFPLEMPPGEWDEQFRSWQEAGGE